MLGILPLLRDRVGPAGRVVGLDLEPRMLELAASHGPEIEKVAADASATGLPTGSFDLVHARTLLINVTNPETILAELARIARPGGAVALQEPDAAAWVCDPPHPAFERLRDRVIDVYPRVGKDFRLGRRIARLLRGAGLRDVQVRATARVTRPDDYYHTFLLTLCGLLREPLLAAGELTAGQLDGDSAALREHLGHPHTVTCMPLMWQAWGVKA